MRKCTEPVSHVNQLSQSSIRFLWRHDFSRTHPILAASMGVACRSIVDRRQPLLDARIASLRILLPLAILQVLGCGATSLLSFQCFSHTHRLESRSKRRLLDLVGHCPVLERHSHAVVLYAAVSAGRRVTALQVVQSHLNLVAARTLALELALASGRNFADYGQLAVLFSFSNDDRTQLTFPSPWVSEDFSSVKKLLSCNSHCCTVSYLSLARILSNIDSCSSASLSAQNHLR